MSDLDADWVGQPSDELLVTAIRRARGLPPDAPISPHVVREVRHWSAGQARRWSRARRLRLPVPVPHAAPTADAAVREAIDAVMGGPEMAVLMYLLLSLPDLTAALVEGAMAMLAASPRHAAAPIRAYAAVKAGRGPWPPRWGTVGARAYVGGLLVPCRSPADLGPHPLHVAACNAASPAAVAAWVDLLDSSDAARLGVLAEMEAAGAAACRALPLPLWLPEDGPPRGVWPPPPPGDGTPPPPAAPPPPPGPGVP